MKFRILCSVLCFALGSGDQDTVPSIKYLGGSEQVRGEEHDRSYTRRGRCPGAGTSSLVSVAGLSRGGDV